MSKKPCEIDISLAARLKAGALTTVVPAKDKAAETVFKLTLKGDFCPLITAASPVKEEPKEKVLPPCTLEKALTERINAGSLFEVIPNDNNDEVVFSIKLKGAPPQLKPAVPPSPKAKLIQNPLM